MKAIRFVVACTALAGAGIALAQSVAPPQNVLQLSASGTVEVQQDLLTIRLTATRDGNDAAAVQAQLKSVLDAALAEARASAKSGQLDVHTGNFNLGPRTNRDGKITGWQGSAELVLEGRDFARLSQVAGRLTALNISDVSFNLSREQRAKAEAEAQAMAIDAFKQKAASLAKGFGFANYTLREIAVNSNEGGFQPRMRAMAASKMSIASDAAVPVEAGKTSVVVNVSGAVQLK